MSPAAPTATRARVAARPGRAVPERARPVPARAPLRVVRAAEPARPGRRAALAGTAAAALLVLTVVAFHVLLVQGQVDLDHLQRETGRAQARYQAARLEHAQLSSPARLLGEATRLGLVSPTRPPVAVEVAGGAARAPDGATPTLDGWTTVKPSLGTDP